METEYLYFINHYETEEVAVANQLLSDWHVLVRLLFSPVMMQINDSSQEVYQEKKLNRSLVKDEATALAAFSLTDGINRTTIHLNHEKILEETVIQETIFREKQQLLTSYLEERFKNCGVFSYLRSYREYLLHNTQRIDYRKSFEEAVVTEGLPKRRNQAGEIIVDGNQFAGYDILYRGLCLTSCWRMYYGPKYLTFIPKRLFLELQQIEVVEEIGPEAVRIDLYKDPFNWQHPSNIHYQRLFRDQLGIDQLAWDNGVGILRDPYIEYTFAGDTVQTVQYQNDYLQPTSKKKATVFVTRTYNYFKQLYQEKRIKGSLNPQAFFPWIDDEHHQMINYKVLIPSLTLDRGVEAYEYYIRNYLELDVAAGKYQTYTPILYLYLPSGELAELPIEKLTQQLKDVQIKQSQTKEGGVQMELKKEKYYLKVIFLEKEKGNTISLY